VLSSNSLHCPDIRQSSVVEQEGCRLGGGNGDSAHEMAIETVCDEG
jgi:hypothetical protein